MNYTKEKLKRMSTVRLLSALKRGKKEWGSLPKKSSFSGLHVSRQLDMIQQVLEKRGVEFNPIYTEITIEIPF